MSDIDKTISEVDSSMTIEVLPLTSDDKDRIRLCLTDPSGLDQMIKAIIKKYTAAAKA